MHVRCTDRSKNTTEKMILIYFTCQTATDFISLNKVSKCILRTCVQALLYHVFVKRSANSSTSTFGRTASELEPSLSSEPSCSSGRQCCCLARGDSGHGGRHRRCHCHSHGRCHGHRSSLR